MLAHDKHNKKVGVLIKLCWCLGDDETSSKNCINVVEWRSKMSIVRSFIFLKFLKIMNKISLFNSYCKHISRKYQIKHVIILQVVAGSGDRGWLDGSLEHQNWLKLIQSTSSRNGANLKYYLQGGQVCEILLLNGIYTIALDCFTYTEDTFLKF